MSSNIHSASHEEILERTLKRAINNGLTGYWKDRYESCVHLDELEYLFHENDESDPRFLIFNHDFAKALWGEATHTVTGQGLNDYERNEGWQYHLQKMVIAEDPIAYLGEHI